MQGLSIRSIAFRHAVVPLSFAAFVLTAGATSPSHAAQYAAKLVRCSDTAWPGNCGGDNLTAGQIRIEDDGRVRVRVVGALADSFNLYEVYWLPVGAAVTDAIRIGNFATKCNGNRNAWLSDITTPREAKSATAVNMLSRAANVSAGNFLVFSRGPWATDADGNCRIEQLNTTPLGLDRDLPLANPAVDLASDGVQFISGYSVSSP